MLLTRRGKELSGKKKELYCDSTTRGVARDKNTTHEETCSLLKRPTDQGGRVAVRLLQQPRVPATRETVDLKTGVVRLYVQNAELGDVGQGGVVSL